MLLGRNQPGLGVPVRAVDHNLRCPLRVALQVSYSYLSTPCVIYSRAGCMLPLSVMTVKLAAQ